MKVKQNIYTLILEWDGDEWISATYPKYHVTPYYPLSRQEYDELREDAEKHSYYDYVDIEMFTSEKDMNDKMEYYRNLGAIIHDK